MDLIELRHVFMIIFVACACQLVTCHHFLYHLVVASKLSFSCRDFCFCFLSLLFSLHIVDYFFLYTYFNDTIAHHHVVVFSCLKLIFWAQFCCNENEMSWMKNIWVFWANQNETKRTQNIAALVLESLQIKI